MRSLYYCSPSLSVLLNSGYPFCIVPLRAAMNCSQHIVMQLSLFPIHIISVQSFASTIPTKIFNWARAHDNGMRKGKTWDKVIYINTTLNEAQWLTVGINWGLIWDISVGDQHKKLWMCKNYTTDMSFYIFHWWLGTNILAVFKEAKLH